MPGPILLIASRTVADPVASALQLELDLTVEVETNRRAGHASVRRGNFELVVLDEAIASADPADTDLLYAAAAESAGAPVLEVNFALSGASRVVRQVRSALLRRMRDKAQARTAAASDLRSELRESLSGLLLQSELALQDAPPAQAHKLRYLVELAGDLGNRLQVDGER